MLGWLGRTVGFTPCALKRLPAGMQAQSQNPSQNQSPSALWLWTILERKAPVSRWDEHAKEKSKDGTATYLSKYEEISIVFVRGVDFTLKEFSIGVAPPRKLEVVISWPWRTVRCSFRMSCQCFAWLLCVEKILVLEALGFNPTSSKHLTTPSTTRVVPTKRLASS